MRIGMLERCQVVGGQADEKRCTTTTTTKIAAAKDDDDPIIRMTKRVDASVFRIAA